MKYEWDEAKDISNQQKHGISFEIAALVFEDENCLISIDRIDEETSEQRWRPIGKAQIEPRFEALLLVARVYREEYNGGQIIRIISARAAEKREIRRYKDRRWSEKEKQALRRIARQQAAGNDSQIDFSDIPPSTHLSSLPRWCDCARYERPKCSSVSRIHARVLAWLESKGDGHLTADQ